LRVTGGWFCVLGLGCHWDRVKRLLRARACGGWIYRGRLFGQRGAGGSCWRFCLR
jgi:hypothetical protein